MSTLVVGECLAVETRRAGKGDNTWDETLIRVFDGRNVEVVAVGSVDKFRGALPGRGEVVALEVGIRAWKSDKTGSVGYAVTAFGRSSAVEAALSVSDVASAS